MQLYELEKAKAELLENGFNEQCIDLETGEIDQDKVNALLEQLDGDINAKLESIGCYIKNLSAEVDAFKTEEKSLKERREQKEKKIESLETFLKDAMLRNNKEKFETAKVKLGFRKSESIEVDENIKLDEKYYITKVTQTVDKKFLKEELKSGVIIDGVRLIEKQNLQIK